MRDVNNKTVPAEPRKDRNTHARRSPDFFAAFACVKKEVSRKACKHPRKQGEVIPGGKAVERKAEKRSNIISVKRKRHIEKNM